MNRRSWIPVTVALAFVSAVTLYVLNVPGPTVNADPLEESSYALDTPKVDVPAGTPVSVVLQTSLTARTTNEGDRFSARVAAPVLIDGVVAIPAGAAVHGHVVLAEQPGGSSGPGRLQLIYDQIDIDGRGYDLEALSQVYGALVADGLKLELGAGSTLRFTLDHDVTVLPAA